MATHTLVRPRRGRLVGGVCAGLAQRFGLPRWLTRLLFVLFAPGPNLLVYLLLWVLIPEE